MLNFLRKTLPKTEAAPPSSETKEGAKASSKAAVSLNDLPKQVLLSCSSPARLLDLCAELVRLECLAFEVQSSGDTNAILIDNPPMYTVMRAIETNAGIRIYTANPVGQRKTFSELNAKGSKKLSVSDDSWTSLNAAHQMSFVNKDNLKPGKAPKKRTVSLRLCQSRATYVASLWLLDSFEEVDNLFQYLPESIINQLVFAVVDDRIILKATSMRKAPPDLSNLANAYYLLNQTTNIYLPVGNVIEPALRPGRLKDIISIPQNEIGWLANIGQDLRINHLDATTFHSLSEWANYTVTDKTARLPSYVRSKSLIPELYSSIGTEWQSDETDEELSPKRKRRK